MEYLQYFLKKQHTYDKFGVLNLIITGIPSIRNHTLGLDQIQEVLNLIITGLPSILCTLTLYMLIEVSFKPYYNWITFNTLDLNPTAVLPYKLPVFSFKPYYNWITFNTKRNG